MTFIYMDLISSISNGLSHHDTNNKPNNFGLIVDKVGHHKLINYPLCFDRNFIYIKTNFQKNSVVLCQSGIF